MSRANIGGRIGLPDAPKHSPRAQEHLFMLDRAKKRCVRVWARMCLKTHKKHFADITSTRRQTGHRHRKQQVTNWQRHMWRIYFVVVSLLATTQWPSNSSSEAGGHLSRCGISQQLLVTWSSRLDLRIAHGQEKVKEGQEKHKNKNRHLQDSNLCSNMLVDFKSTSLTTRTRCQQNYIVQF